MSTLRIREKQIAAFRKHRLEQAKQQIETMIRRHWSEERDACEGPDILALVDRAFAECEAMGTIVERDVQRYANLVLALGIDFRTAPDCSWATRLLEDTRLRPSTRIDLVCERTPAELRRRYPSPDSRADKFQLMNLASKPDHQFPRSADDPIQRCSAAWMAIELLGPDELPVGNVDYKITLPTGEVRTGRLDAQGFAYEHDVGDGSECEVEFIGYEDVSPRD
jgi:hypothetical protein